MKTKFNSILNLNKTFFKLIRKSINKYPFIWSISLIIIYLLLFQSNFVSMGDAWAESFAEYLDESIQKGWLEVFKQNWAGYYTILPSFISKLYISLGGPIGYSDYYYRIVVVTFAVLSSSIISLKYFRNFIKQDILRILLSLSLVVILFDVSSFSIINIWYLGLVPLVIYCLTPKKSNIWLDIFMGIFGLLITLSKPFIFIIPFFIYRLIKTKQYFGAGMALVGALFQTYQIIFNDQRHLVNGAGIDFKDSLGGILIGAGTSTLKIMGLHSTSYIVIFISLLSLLLLAFLLWKAKGFWISALLCGLFLYTVYTYILAPDGSAYYGIREFNRTLIFNLKSQREILINASLLVSIFAIASYYYGRIFNIFKFKIQMKYIILGLIIFSISIIYRPIDTISAGVSNEPLNAFRNQINSGVPTCVPLAPNVFFFEDANWSFGYKGSCQTLTNDLNIFRPNVSKIDYIINDNNISYNAKFFRLDTDNLQAVVVPVKYTGTTNCSLYLKDTNGGITYESKLKIRKDKSVQLATFNTTGIKQREKYTFKINSSCEGKTFIGRFNTHGEIMTYPYFFRPFDN